MAPAPVFIYKMKLYLHIANNYNHKTSLNMIFTVFIINLYIYTHIPIFICIQTYNEWITSKSSVDVSF